MLEIGSRSFELNMGDAPLSALAGGPTATGCGTAATGDARRGQGVSSGRRGGHEERLGSSFPILILLLGGTSVHFCLTRSPNLT